VKLAQARGSRLS